MTKRLLDVVASAVGLALLIPLFVVMSVAVKLSDSGPILYRARRVGRDGKLFDVLKFRTMTANGASDGPVITASGDSRVTKFGRVLRQTKLDELPQLINVLRGEMSLVGPRPEDPRYVALYTDQQRRLLDERPGITSAASLYYRNEEELLTGPGWEATYKNVVLPEKLRIDLEYMNGRSLWTDVRLILKTISAGFR